MSTNERLVELARKYFDLYIEAEGWDDELDEKWPESLLSDRAVIEAAKKEEA